MSETYQCALCNNTFSENELGLLSSVEEAVRKMHRLPIQQLNKTPEMKVCKMHGVEVVNLFCEECRRKLEKEIEKF